MNYNDMDGKSIQPTTTVDIGAPTEVWSELSSYECSSYRCPDFPYEQLSFAAIGEDLNNVAKYVSNTVLNDDPKKCGRTWLSFYKGVPVFKCKKQGLFRNASTGAFGGIFLINENPDSDSFENDLKHEYGHCVTLAMIGPLAYTFKVAIPSAYNCKKAETNPVTNRAYYSYPWERAADLLGGATRAGDDSYLFDASGVYSILFILGN